MIPVIVVAAVVGRVAYAAHAARRDGWDVELPRLRDTVVAAAVLWAGYGPARRGDLVVVGALVVGLILWAAWGSYRRVRDTETDGLVEP